MEVSKRLGIVISGMVLATSFLFASLPVDAAVIVAQGATGTQPAALSPLIVQASDYVFPLVTPATNSAPQDILIEAANAYPSAQTEELILNIAGAFYSPIALDSSNPSAVSVAPANLNGSIGTFSSVPGVTISVLSNELIISNISANWQFIDLTDLIYTDLTGLATPGTKIMLSGSIVDQSNPNLVFETLAATPVIVSERNVPSPGTLALLGVGLAALGAMRWRKAA